MLYENQELNIDDLFVFELKYIMESYNYTLGESM